MKQSDIHQFILLLCYDVLRVMICRARDNFAIHFLKVLFFINRHYVENNC